MTVAQDNSVQRRSVALSISLVLHGLLVLFLILYKIITPIPPFPEPEGGGNGLELALGVDILGMGDNAKDPAPAAASAQPVPAEEETAPLTNEAETESPAVNENKKDDKPKKQPEREKPKQPTQEERNKAFNNKLNDLWNNKGSGQEGHGASDTPGNAGGANGSPNGNGIGNGTGSYRGDGWSVDLAGRTIRKKPVINDKPSVAGKVVMDIWVDGDGKVVRVAQNTNKSTTLDQSLVAIAKRAALESSFYPNPKATGEQKGSMSFTFDLE